MRRVVGICVVILIFICGTSGVWLYRSWETGVMPWEESELRNVYICKEEGTVVLVHEKGRKTEYKVKGAIREQAYQGIADVYVRGTRVTKVICKPEKVRGRILEIGEESLDVENYGMLKQATNCTYYIADSGFQEGKREDLYIGQEDAEFVVANGEICSVIYRHEKENETKERKENIRVMIKTDGYAGYDHGAVTLRGTSKMYVKSGKAVKEYAPGEQVEFTPENMKEKRSVVTSEEGGRIEVLSIKRNMGNPSYRGRLELVKAEGGIHIINELDVEEYLYGVVPSEMPADYEKEALKAQAVCARSYAIQHIRNHRMKEMGAHVDDSVSYQVYNNINEDGRCNQAVDETKGQKVYHEESIAATYFFPLLVELQPRQRMSVLQRKKFHILQGNYRKKYFLRMAISRMLSWYLGCWEKSHCSKNF